MRSLSLCLFCFALLCLLNPVNSFCIHTTVDKWHCGEKINPRSWWFWFWFNVIVIRLWFLMGSWYLHISIKRYRNVCVCRIFARKQNCQDFSNKLNAFPHIPERNRKNGELMNKCTKARQHSAAHMYNNNEMEFHSVQIMSKLSLSQSHSLGIWLSNTHQCIEFMSVCAVMCCCANISVLPNFEN